MRARRHSSKSLGVGSAEWRPDPCPCLSEYPARDVCPPPPWACRADVAWPRGWPKGDSSPNRSGRECRREPWALQGKPQFIATKTHTHSRVGHAFPNDPDPPPPRTHPTPRPKPTLPSTPPSNTTPDKPRENVEAATPTPVLPSPLSSPLLSLSLRPTHPTDDKPMLMPACRHPPGTLRCDAGHAKTRSLTRCRTTAPSPGPRGDGGRWAGVGGRCSACHGPFDSSRPPGPWRTPEGAGAPWTGCGTHCVGPRGVTGSATWTWTGTDRAGRRTHPHLPPPQPLHHPQRRPWPKNAVTAAQVEHGKQSAGCGAGRRGHARHQMTARAQTRAAAPSHCCQTPSRQQGCAGAKGRHAGGSPSQGGWRRWKRVVHCAALGAAPPPSRTRSGRGPQKGFGGARWACTAH